jgi:hypothetical protein
MILGAIDFASTAKAVATVLFVTACFTIVWATAQEVEDDF